MSNPFPISDVVSSPPPPLPPPLSQSAEPQQQPQQRSDSVPDFLVTAASPSDVSSSGQLLTTNLQEGQEEEITPNPGQFPVELLPLARGRGGAAPVRLGGGGGAGPQDFDITPVVGVSRSQLATNAVAAAAAAATSSLLNTSGTPGIGSYLSSGSVEPSPPIGPTSLFVTPPTSQFFVDSPNSPFLHTISILGGGGGGTVPSGVGQSSTDFHTPDQPIPAGGLRGGPNNQQFSDISQSGGSTSTTATTRRTFTTEINRLKLTSKFDQDLVDTVNTVSQELHQRRLEILREVADKLKEDSWRYEPVEKLLGLKH